MKYIYLIVFIALNFPLTSFASEDFVTAACNQDLSKMAQIYATTDLDLNYVAKNGMTALTCITKSRNLEGLKLLIQLRNSNLDINALDKNGDGFISSVLGDTGCDLKCETFFEASLGFVSSKLDLEKQLIKGKVLTASDLSFDLKMMFTKVLSFEKIINAKDAAGGTLLSYIVTKTGLKNKPEIEYFNELLRFPQIDISPLQNNSINLLSFPYLNSGYPFKKEILLEYYQNIARMKTSLDQQLNPSWLSEDSENLITLALKNQEDEEVGIFLLDHFNFLKTTLLQINKKGIALCNVAFRSPILFQKLIEKQALTEECADFSNRASFVKYDFTSLMNYPGMQKSTYTNSSDFFYATNEKNISVMHIPFDKSDDPDRIYVFDENVWPLKLIKSFEFSNGKMHDIIMTKQGNVLTYLYKTEDMGRRGIHTKAPIVGINLETLELTTAPWEEYKGQQVYPAQYYSYNGLDYLSSTKNFGQDFCLDNKCSSNKLYLRYFEPPQLQSNVLNDPQSVLLRQSDLTFGNSQYSVVACFDAQHCLAYDFGADNLKRWFVLEGTTWRMLDVVSTNFTEKNKEIVFSDSSYTVGWLGNYNPNHFDKDEDQALIFDPVQSKFSVGKKRKEYFNFIPGTHWKLVVSATNFFILKIEIRDLNSEELISTCYAPEKINLDRPLYFSQKQKEIHFFLREVGNKESQFLRVQCN